MTDAEISHRLALAIGWKADQNRIYHIGTSEQRVEVLYTPRHARKGHKVWRRFDHRDPAVIWPIAARFDCFPSMQDGEGAKAWDVWIDADKGFVYAETAAKAIALAVIKAHEGAKE